MATRSNDSKSGRLQFDAHELAKALRPLMAKGVRVKQVGPIQLSFTNSHFVVAGSWFGTELPATGEWPGAVEVAPATFLSLLRGLPESGSLALVLQDGVLALGGQSIRIATEEPSSHPSTRDASPSQSPDSKNPAVVLVGRADFEAACSLIVKHCGSSSQHRARIGFASNRLEIEIAGLGTQMRASGSWPGTATVHASFMLGIAKLPPAGDPISIRVEDGRLHIATSSITCTWQPSDRNPRSAPSVHTLEWSGALPPEKWTDFQKKVLSKFSPTEYLELTLTLKAMSKAGVSKQKLDETKSVLRELGLNDDVSTK